MDNFLKNICSDKSTVTVKDTGEYTWGYDTFSEPIDQTWEVVKYITNHQKPLSMFRKIVSDSDTWEGQEKPTQEELVKYCETRFASKILMLQRYQILKSALVVLMGNPAHKPG